MIRFITGPSGSGKTTLARDMSERLGYNYVDYDNIHGYSNICPERCLSFLKSLKGGDIVDAIPADAPGDSYPTLKTFNEWVSKRNDVDIYCLFTKKEDWLKRKPAGGTPLTGELWFNWWTEIFPSISIPIYKFNDKYEFMDHDTAMSLIDMKGLITRRIETVPKSCDSKYQDIPEIGLVGYSKTHQSWERIKSLADWKDSSIVECGCAHGYFPFRIEDEGCEKPIIGLDRVEDLLITSRAINAYRGGNIKFVNWSAGEEIPEADVTLCMNAIHHFPSDDAPDPKPFLDNLKSPLVIFEADTRFKKIFDNRFSSVEVFESARPNREIYRCEQ